MKVAETILQQMGGQRRLALMVGAYNFLSHENDSVSFRFKGNAKMNYLKVTLNGMDTYDLEFGKVWGSNYKVVKELSGIYNDQLKDVFEKTTKLYLKL